MNHGEGISRRRRGGRSTIATAAAGMVALVLLSLCANAPEARSEAGAPTAEPVVTADVPAARPRAELRRRGRPIYWGAWIGKQLTGEQPPWDMGAVSKFERIVGKKLSLVEFAAPFAECYSSNCNFYGFPSAEMQRVRGHGAIPFFSWSSQSIPGKVREPAFQLSDVIRGRFDGYIRGWARAAKRWGHPFFLRFNWEMNGNWFPWGVGVNGNRRPQFVRAWRHVHRIFSRVGANNATWVWCPFVDPEGRDNLRAFYPGGRYVDWTCLDGYNWGRGNPALSRPWRSFGELFHSSYRRIVRRIARRKPMIIGEVASSDYGGSKAAWIRNMLAKVPRRYPRIRGLIWFNSDDRGANWQIEASRSGIRAFRRGINRGVYRGNRFSRIHRSPIRPARARR